MARQHEIFVKGCELYSNMTKTEAEKIWDLFEPFQGYGFNKAHAACYGRVAYQTAYMKALFPTEYMCAVLTAESGDIGKTSTIINECKRIRIQVLPPDVNSSDKDFTMIKGTNNNQKDTIRFGLLSIKNVGVGIVENIVQERTQGGLFLSLADFLERVISKDLNKKSIEALAKAGALDELGERKMILNNIDRILEYAKDGQRAKIQNQATLFSMMSDQSTVPVLKLLPTLPALLDEKLGWEKELLGLYISGHPLDKFAGSPQSKKIVTIAGLKSSRPSTSLTTRVIIGPIRRIITKGGDPMLFIKLMDQTDDIEAVVFPRILEQYGQLIAENRCVALRGKFNERNGIPAIIAEEISLL